MQTATAVDRHKKSRKRVWKSSGHSKKMINNVWEMIHETKIMIDIVLQLLLFVVVSNY